MHVDRHEGHGLAIDSDRGEGQVELLYESFRPLYVLGSCHHFIIDEVGFPDVVAATIVERTYPQNSPKDA
jgi:hypothetical protein